MEIISCFHVLLTFFSPFQVVIFVRNVQRCVALASLLQDQNFPAIDIHRAMAQKERFVFILAPRIVINPFHPRLARYQQFKEFEKRILVATNLFGRGMDIERVNIVINYDMPEDSDTYLHRVSRAGRFGTKGLAITFVSSEEDSQILAAVQKRFDVQIPEMPQNMKTSAFCKLCPVFWKGLMNNSFFVFVTVKSKDIAI